MIKNKLKELHLTNSTRENEANNNLRGKRIIHQNDKPIPRIGKKNLPELKLSKLKSKINSETEGDSKEDQKASVLKQNKSHSKYKQNKEIKEIIFPDIKNKKNAYDIKPLANNINTINVNKPKTTLPIKAKGKTNINTNSNTKSRINQLYSNPIRERDFQMDQIDLMTEKLNMINSLFNSLSNLPGGISMPGLPSMPLFNFSKPIVAITPSILNQTIPKFQPSITSQINEFSNEEYIKAYAYNTHQGNIRDYNEDTVHVSKVNNSFYCFGVYDGHGGNGCSIFLRDNLHNYIKEFSSEGIKQAIIDTEDYFIKNKAKIGQFDIGDPSGSCGIIVCIKGRQCIIANVGDSRCVVYKNQQVDFSTVDHKPGSDEEKERITKAGGKIYHTPSLFPLYQNGEQISGPWRVLPGRLSVSRTFGDVEAKVERFGGMKGVVVAIPDITLIDLTDEYNFIVLGCDGIFDVMSNEEILECVNIVLKERTDYEINQLCGEVANMIIKSALVKDSFDNVSCIVIALNMK